MNPLIFAGFIEDKPAAPVPDGVVVGADGDVVGADGEFVNAFEIAVVVDVIAGDDGDSLVFGEAFEYSENY